MSSIFGLWQQEQSCYTGFNTTHGKLMIAIYISAKGINQPSAITGLMDRFKNNSYVIFMVYISSKLVLCGVRRTLAHSKRFRDYGGRHSRPGPARLTTNLPWPQDGPTTRPRTQFPASPSSSRKTRSSSWRRSQRATSNKEEQQSGDLKEFPGTDDDEETIIILSDSSEDW